MALRGGKMSRLIQLVLALAAIVSVVAGLVAIHIYEASKPAPLTNKTATTADWTLGDAKAPHVLIEYGDFQCPSCAAYNSLAKQAVDKSRGQLKLVYREFPLALIHGYAMLAAQAAEAAGQQGQFWPMHDLLYGHQTDWSSLPAKSEVQNRFVQYAQQLHLNTDQFRRDMASSLVARRIEVDEQGGLAGHVVGTPTFFLDGRRLPAVNTAKAFDDEINKLLAPQA